MKLIWKLFKLAVFIVILAAVFYNLSAKYLLTWFLSSTLGVPAKIESARFDLANTQVKFEGIELRNPAGFPDGILVNIPEIFIDFEISSLWEGRLHLQTVEIDCRDIRVVRDVDGRINWLSLKVLKSAPPKSEARPRKTVQKPVRFYIDRLVLSLGFATYVDVAGPNQVQRSFNLHIDHAVYRNVDSYPGIIKIITWEIMKQMGVGKLTEAFKRLEGEYNPKGWFAQTVASLKSKFQ